VRILLDEQLPRALARHLSVHLVRTVQQSGWSGLKNGALLLRAAAAGFQIFVTADRSLGYQQNLAGSPLALLVLTAQSTALEDLIPLVPALLRAIEKAQPGSVTRVEA
jgi:predicted nuclease of predicted toxin-antitoxin system